MSAFNIMDNTWDFISSFEGMDRETSAFLTFFIFWIFFCLIIAFISWLFRVITRWIFFSKSGESGWKAIIPVYDEITLLKISGLHWWWIFLIYAASIFSIIQLIVNLSLMNIDVMDYSIISLAISLLSFPLSIATIIAKINECNNISKKYNKGPGHTALIFFFEPIMFLIMGLSKEYVYDKDLDVPKNGFFSK